MGSKLQTPNSKLQLIWNLVIGNWKLRRGFGLFELMVVITIIGITISVITASFLTFEKNQRLKNAANAMKNEIRLAQSKALSGDKGPLNTAGENPCSNDSADGETLIGWYMNIDTAITNDPYQHFYTIKGDCSDPSEPAGWRIFGEKTIQLPKNVNVNKFIYGSTDLSEQAVNILYQPLTHNVLFFYAHGGPPLTPPFLSSGQIDESKLIGASMIQSPLTIELKNIQDNRTYNVIIQPSGEVNEVKP